MSYDVFFDAGIESPSLVRLQCGVLVSFTNTIWWGQVGTQPFGAYNVIWACKNGSKNLVYVDAVSVGPIRHAFSGRKPNAGQTQPPAQGWCLPTSDDLTISHSFLSALHSHQFASIMRVPVGPEGAHRVYQLPSQDVGISPIFKVRHMSSRVTSITESDNYGQTPHMYMIRGEDRIVLVDTGVGTGDLRAFIQSHANPANLPIFVVNSHCHFDHIACNFQFSVPPGGAADGCLGIGVSGYDKAFTSALLERAFRDGEGDIPPLPRFTVTKWLQDGEKIVLSDGNPRDALEVLWLPGHCPDELALYDPLDRRLYVGDIIYRYFPICIFSEGSNFEQFEASIDRLIDFVNARDGFNPKSPIMLSAGHVDEEMLSFYLVELKTLLERMRKKEIEPEQLTEHIAGYERGSVLWITVNTVPAEQLTPYDVAVATGAIEPFTKPSSMIETPENGWMNAPLAIRNHSKTFRARVGHKCRYM